MKRPSPALVAHWYAKLRAAGFRDIEGGRDLNKLHTWTFRGASGEHDSTVVEAWPDGFEPQRTLADHPTAVYHRGLEHEGRKLRGQRRRLMLIASNGTAAAGGRDKGITRQVAARQVKRFATSIGLVREAHGS